jgi:AcrR family transcriptional regulator
MRQDQLLEWVKPVRQERSLRTLERLLDAAEVVILERGVEACSVSAVVDRAGSSVGAFYARFPDKESLLRAVCERFLAESLASMNAALDAQRWRGEPLEHVLAAALRFLLRVAEERRPLLACLLTYAAKEPALAAALDRLTEECGARLHALLEARGEQPEHARPTLVTHVLASVLLQYVQAGAMRGALQCGPADAALLTEELTRLCLAYLAPRGRTPATSSGPGRRSR